MRDEVPLKRFDAGQAIRFEPQEKGRFQQLDADHWTRTFYVLPKDIGGSSNLGCCDFTKPCDHKD